MKIHSPTNPDHGSSFVYHSEGQHYVRAHPFDHSETFAHDELTMTPLDGDLLKVKVEQHTDAQVIKASITITRADLDRMIDLLDHKGREKWVR